MSALTQAEVEALISSKAVKYLKLHTSHISNASVPVLSAKLGDVNSKVILVTLFDDDGALTLSNFGDALLSAKFADGTVYAPNSSGVSKTEANEICIVVPATILAKAGAAKCEITLASTGDTPTSLTSESFYINVIEPQYNQEAMEGDEDYNLLLQTISDAEEAIKENERVTSELQEILDGGGFNAIKEIAEWIEDDTTGSTELVNRVADQSEDIEDLKADALSKEAKIEAIIDGTENYVPQKAVSATNDELNRSIKDTYVTKSETVKVFIGTRDQYDEKYDAGEIQVGTLVIITDDGDRTSAVLGEAILGEMVLG